MTEDALEDATKALLKPVYGAYSDVMDELDGGADFAGSILAGDPVVDNVDDEIKGQLREAEKQYEDVLYN